MTHLEYSKLLVRCNESRKRRLFNMQLQAAVGKLFPITGSHGEANGPQEKKGAGKVSQKKTLSKRMFIIRSSNTSKVAAAQ